MSISNAQIEAAAEALLAAQPTVVGMLSRKNIAALARAALEAGEAAAWSTDMEAAPKDRPLLVEDQHGVWRAEWGEDLDSWTDPADGVKLKRWRHVPTPPTEGDR